MNAGVLAFLLALFGFALNMAGWFVFNSRVVSGLGLLLVVAGVVGGVVAIALGQLALLRSRASKTPKQRTD